MQRRQRIRAGIISAILSLGITLMTVWVTFAQIGVSSPWLNLAHIASLPLYPGALMVAFLGLGHGAHGMPNQEDHVMFLFTFLLWWGVIYGAWRLWTRSDR